MKRSSLCLHGFGIKIHGVLCRKLADENEETLIQNILVQATVVVKAIIVSFASDKQLSRPK